MCTVEGSTDKIRRGKRDVENFVDCVEAYFQITTLDKQKVIRELHEDFKKKHITVKQLLIRIHSACLSPSTAMV